jgi:hypothetical protein
MSEMLRELSCVVWLMAGALFAGTGPDKPTSFCYGTVGPHIQARLQLHNSDAHDTMHVTIHVQTVAGETLGAAVERDLAPGADFEAVYEPAEKLEQIWAVLTVTGYKLDRKRNISMHSDGPVEGAMITEKTVGAEVKTRTSTLTPILVQDPHDRPRGVEPNKAVHRLGAFFTGEYAFIGNPRERQLDVSFCGVRTKRCWQFGLPARAAVSVSRAEFEAKLGISGPQDSVALDFRGAAAFLNMRNAGADSAITFGDEAPSHR